MELKTELRIRMPRSNKAGCYALGFLLSLGIVLPPLFAREVKEANVAGQFYPADKEGLEKQISVFLDNVRPQEARGDIFFLISPHAGYEFSGQTAAYGYRFLKGFPYKTVVIIGPSHYFGFEDISIYPAGEFRTPLGSLEIDSEFAGKMISPERGISFIPQAFSREHSVEVQLPFLQKVLSGFKIVPIVIGQCGMTGLRKLADSLAEAIGGRRDVLLVASTDLTHSNDYRETETVDKLNLAYLEKMSPDALYERLSDGTARMCGGLPVVAMMLTARKLGYDSFNALHYTNSAEVTGRKIEGVWTVGYLSAVINKKNSGGIMLSIEEKRRLLEIARRSIEGYLVNGKYLDSADSSAELKAVSGAFVTLHKKGELRGCIGNIVGQKPLIETVRDMAIEAAVADPRFSPVSPEELKDIDIEVSVLSPLKKVSDISEFQLGIHGVLVRRGQRQGVFLPQVANETGWSKEQFLSYLCSHKAGLPADSWKDPETEIFIFSALIFSEKELK